MSVCVWPCMLSTPCVFVSGCGSWPEQHSGEPLALLTLVERGVELISSPHPLRWRGGGDKGSFPNATAKAGASRGGCFELTLTICSAWENYEQGVQRNKRLIEGRCAVVSGVNHPTITGQGAQRLRESRRKG